MCGLRCASLLYQITLHQMDLECGELVKMPQKGQLFFVNNLPISQFAYQKTYFKKNLITNKINTEYRYLKLYLIF